MNPKMLLVKGVKALSKHDRTILTGVSIASGVAAVVLAWNARPKCEQLMIELDEKGASKKERALAYGKVLLPTGVALAVSVATKVVEHKKAGEQITSLINGANTYKTIDDLRKDAEKELLPEEKVKTIEDKVDEKMIEKISQKEPPEETGHGNVLFIEPRYTAKLWRGNKDFFDLAISKCDKKLYACYDPYGCCKNDEFSITFRDIFKELDLRVAEMFEMYEYKGRDYRSVPVHLEAHEFDNGELGYKVVFDRSPSIGYSDLID